MMYANKMAVAIKTNGRVLREHNKDTVFVKFGSEYSVYMKNLNTQRAIVNVYIDGTNIVEGGLVLNAGQEVDLERSIINGNLSAGNKLKFIERTSAIENGPRGVKLEDGLIRVEFQFEAPRPVININDVWWKNSIVGQTGGAYYGTGVPRDTFYATNGTSASGISGSLGTDRFTVTASGANQMNVNGVMRGIDLTAGESTKAAAASATNATLKSMNISAQAAHDGMATMDWNDVGITVPGSKSEQKFTHTTMGALDPEKHTIVLKILGETPDNKPVTEAVTVKKKPKCVTCGKQNKATASFCSACGTALEIFA
jgi:hypothetical protein